MTSRHPLIAACTVVAVTALIGCGARTHPSESQRIETIDKGDRYVAIGDSYTAAPGTGPVSADNGCEQSTTNYPHLVARRLRLHLVDVSCGGASTLHVAAPEVLGRVDQPPQGQSVTRATDLVTVSLGANDFMTFFDVVYRCTTLRAADPEGAPCATSDAVAGTNSVARRAGRIERRLVRVIRLVRARAPSARIVVVGYPQIFPVRGPCTQLPVAAGDFAFVRHVNELLVHAQKQAATTARVTYLDTFKATQGHDMCADQPWIAGATPKPARVLAYHPYPEEQRVIADLLVDVLR
jgi:lysophospholipase L1-like esterase